MCMFADISSITKSGRNKVPYALRFGPHRDPFPLLCLEIRALSEQYVRSSYGNPKLVEDHLATAKHNCSTGEINVVKRVC